MKRKKKNAQLLQIYMEYASALKGDVSDSNNAKDTYKIALENAIIEAAIKLGGDAYAEIDESIAPKEEILP